MTYFQYFKGESKRPVNYICCEREKNDYKTKYGITRTQFVCIKPTEMSNVAIDVGIESGFIFCNSRLSSSFRTVFTVKRIKIIKKEQKNCFKKQEKSKFCMKLNALLFTHFAQLSPNPLTIT